MTQSDSSVSAIARKIANMESYVAIASDSQPVQAAIIASLVAMAGFVAWFLNKQRSANRVHTQLDIEQTEALIEMIRETHEAATTINDAVNHRHRYTENEETPPKLFDQVNTISVRIHEIAGAIDKIREWMDGYYGSKLHNAEAVNAFVDQTNEVIGWMKENHISRQEMVEAMNELLEKHRK